MTPEHNLEIKLQEQELQKALDYRNCGDVDYFFPDRVKQAVFDAMTEYAMIFANSINDELNYALAEGERLSETAKHWQQKSAEKDKEIAELRGDVLYWKGIAETPEVGKKTIEQFLERELAAAKDRIEELEKEVEEIANLKDYWFNRCYQAEDYISKLGSDNSERMNAYLLWQEAVKNK